jgi:hypothetical protein
VQAEATAAAARLASLNLPTLPSLCCLLPLLLLLLLSQTSQGKLEPDARQALIAKGQALKQQLEELEGKLVQVRELGVNR